VTSAANRRYQVHFDKLLSFQRSNFMKFGVGPIAFCGFTARSV
jgi:hypothetical protein